MQIQYLEVRHLPTNELVDAIGIADLYSTIQVAFNQNHDITLEQLKEAAEKYHWETLERYNHVSVKRREIFTIEAEAKDIPDQIGSYVVSIKTIDVD